MRKITDFIVEKRNIILVMFIIITGVCLFMQNKVNINYDITKYLPSDSETRIGKDIMDKDFKEIKSSTLNVMFKDLSNDEKKETLKNLKEVDGVSSVDYDDTKEYNKDEYTLYTLNVDDYAKSDTAKEVYEEVKENFKVAAYSGTIYEENKPVLQLWIIALAITMAMIILIIMSPSFIEPFLYLFAIGIAVFINKGTNIMFDSVSNITNSIAAILQLALSMDYSIMLSNRFRQEKEVEKDKEKAMKKALFESFKAISSSSVTTIVGLLALIFMSFTIGKDLGFVLAKGVLLSLISIFFCLPGLLLIFDKAISKTKKKEPHFNLTKLGKFSYKTRYIQLVMIIIVFIVSYLIKGNLKILYTGSEQDEVGKVFKASNQIAIVYENKYEDIISKYCKKIEDDQNIDQVLCYGNTINEKLAYDELNEKLKDLGQDTEIEDYLIKLIYYNYYSKDINNTMSFDEFIRFIKSDIYTNPNLADSISNDVKNNIDLLENFTNHDLISRKRTASDIANILSIDKKSIESLLVYYNSKKLNNKMTIKEFVTFMNKDVLTDSTYSASIDKNTKASLKQLETFTNTNIISRKMNYSEIASVFGIDKSLVKQLFLLYSVKNETETKLTLNEFSSYVLNDVSKNETYKNLFDNATLNSLKLLNTLSNDNVINSKMSSTDMVKILGNYGLNEDMLNQIYLLYAIKSDTDTKINISEFINIALSLSSDSKYSGYFNSQIVNSLNKLSSLLNYYDKALDANTLYAMFGNSNLDLNTISIIVTTYGTDNKMTPLNFINQLINSGNITDSNSLKELNYLKIVIENKDNRVDYNNMSKLMNIDSSLSKTIYGIYDYNKGIKLSPKMLIAFILNNKDDALIKDKITPYIDTLNFASVIMNNTKTKYDYKGLGGLIKIDINTVKNIYGLYDSDRGIKLSPYEFVSFILNNQNDKLLKGNLDKATLNNLNLVKKVMTSTLNKTSYNANELSNILGVPKDTLKLLFSLYDSKYKNKDSKISLIDLTDFILNDVIKNPTFKDSFDNESIDKLKTINAVMKNSLKNTEYNASELYAVLNKLTDEVDSKLVDTLYIYHGSINNYDNKWKMTVEEVINYVNKDVLNDDRFKDFIDSDMNKKIKDAKTSIDDAKELLVTDKYSRAILNTKYAYEDDDTFKFIENALDEVGSKDGVYVIGDSPMALEMSKSFNGELDLITVLTMLFIFIVVAITFKSLLIPFILVLIIQCAVYLTMGILSMLGGKVYFISLLIVQAILMGATIDYAIVYTSYYKESRLTMSVKDSIINAYNKSIHTILTSSSVLIIVTLIVACFASEIAAKICETLSQGTLCSVLLILLIMPGILAACDKLICKKGYKGK